MADEYEITTLADLMKVPADKWDELLADLRIWMDLRASAAPLVEAGLLEIGETMTWVDDGKRGLNSLNLTLEIGG